MTTVVLVGLRAGALDAAERLGLGAVAVTEAPPGPRRAARLAGHVQASFAAPPDAWRRVARSLRAHRPAAIVALTERSVLPAAHLRAVLGLDGLTVEAAHACTDKRAMKRAARAAGLACADVVEAEEGLSADALVERLGLPLVVKPAVGSGGRGATVCRTRADVPDALDPGWMAESFVDGVEMSAETLGGSETGAGGSVWTNATRYVVPTWASLLPAPPETDGLDAVRALAEAARRALGVDRGMTHLEAFQTAGGPVFGEMAARPPGGHLMALVRLAYGVDPWEAVLRAELGDNPGLPAHAARSAAAWIVHPGAGRVTRAEGAEACRALPGVEEVVLRVAPGDVVGPRTGSGEEVGHVLVTGATAAEAEARLRAARDALRVEVA
ncbi:ATP-grasp domain-containing protein [Rubrivirga sp. S365]|uniref:ATP-grasp domain-containing protein n=1 Tax=Rubrivirga litoralis TaxID=3075598 RepID=A0ABU3BN84_9BACT|nr:MULTISPECIES: ATP-grasp domain-containing protein [unclassified Rubrivirga]MDT0630730.1 ATP-grasp domain-containing protein [Rubrivirga sp. F394]MDT7856400.1 ATP-grasp domain-containing protein [Rubrivirga sp. S365]